MVGHRIASRPAAARAIVPGPARQLEAAGSAPPAGALESFIDRGNRRLRVRPICPDDAARLAAFYAGATPNDMRLRFFAWRTHIPASELLRSCCLDADREMTLVVLDGPAMVAEVQSICSPDNASAEFALMVAPGWQRMGLGKALLARITAFLRARGTRELRGECLEENLGMARLARRMGFRLAPGPEGTLTMRLALQRAD